MRNLIPVSARAGIVVTGTEVLTGRVQDANGPWIADRLLELGVELAHITICGDRPQDIEAQLRFLADEGVDLIVTSGGLGPTADDMTVEVVARFCGRELVLDTDTETKIADILKKLMAHFDEKSFDAVRAANRKQAMIPKGAQVLDPVGTAPGVVVPGKPTVIVLPGPPRELQPMWHRAIETEAAQQAIAGRTVYEQKMIRMFGLPESGLAESLGMKGHESELFLLGLFSMVDVLVGRPLNEILEEINLAKEVKMALLGEQNRYRDLYELVVSYENGQWEKCAEHASTLNFDPDRMVDIYVKAAEWADGIAGVGNRV